ncbi:NfeD family protein [Marinomonas sp. 2405UD68-3]|uniref:NfeD family protein n=1 Tax=Marinomonas sp. 2405UD68-3 TaxID=3391835 RepID=UPI0039C997C8
MIDLISDFIPHSMIAMGIVLLTIEILVLGFSTFVLFFLGVSLILTGSLMFAGVLPITLSNILLSNALISFLLAIALWKPLKKMQNHTDTTPVKSDFTGLQFMITEEISDMSAPVYKYSGITWKLMSEQKIPANSKVEVVKAEVGVFWVKPF